MTTTTKTKTPDLEDLSTRAMLVKLKIHRWGAKKNDDEMASEVATSKNADPALTKFTKQLLRSDALDSYKKTARKCRKAHKFFTMPWDEGVGLLPAELYFKYTERVGEIRREAEQYVDQFVEEYAKQWNNGLSEYRKGLGGMFDEGDYPDPDRVRTKFGIQIRTYPIQDPNDFRVKLSGKTADGLRRQMGQDLRDDMAEAMRTPILRLHEVVAKVQEKLSNGEAVFRDSLIGNVQELVEILPALNVLGDPKVTEIIERANKEICSVTDVDALRKDEKYRKEVARSADQILKAMRGYVS